VDRMKCNTLHQKFKNIISIGITLIIVILLILSGPANAVLVEISGLSSEYTKDSQVKFSISITLHDPDKFVPITNFSLNLAGPTTKDWIFDTTGRVIQGDPGYININPVIVPNATNYGGPGIGHAIDKNNGEEFDFPYGFGYGSNNGEGDGGDVTYTYDVILSTTNLATGDYKVTASLNTGNYTKPSFTSTEKAFKIKAKPSDGGGGGGGGGTSGEAFENIVCTETDRQFVGKNLDVKYNFTLDCNYVEYIEFTGLISAGKLAAKVEILNDTSTIIDKDAPDIVFKNLNVWIGNMGYFSEKNIKDPTITFKVDRSWVTENDIIPNSISFYSFNDDTKIWEKMSTQKIGESLDSHHFKASLPLRGSLGPMAISGKNLVYVPTSVPTQTAVITPTPNIIEQSNPPITPDATPVTWTGTWKAKVPGFQLLPALIALITLYFISRRRD
jgi:PGF-pre-PGF domain-containing protein